MTVPPHPPGAGLPAAPGASAGPGDPHLSLVEKYFDDNAQDWSDLYGKAQRANDVVLAARRDASVGHIARLVPAGGRVLDAGCGAGLTALELAKRGYRVHLIDVSSKMLALAEHNLSRADVPRERWEISSGDPGSGSLVAGSYDGIAALGFLQYQADELAALRSLHAALKPGGVLVITGPTKTRLAEWIGLAKHYHRLRRRLSRKKPVAPPSPEAIAKAREVAQSKALLHTISAHAYSFGRFRELLEASGFEVLELQGHGFVNFAVIGPKLGFRGEMFLNRFFGGLARVLPIGRWANDLIVVARRR